MTTFTKISVTADRNNDNVVVQQFAGAAKTRTCLLEAMAAANASGLQCAQGMALPEDVAAETARLAGVFSDAADLARRCGGRGYNEAAAL